MEIDNTVVGMPELGQGKKIVMTPNGPEEVEEDYVKQVAPIAYPTPEEQDINLRNRYIPNDKIRIICKEQNIVITITLKNPISPEMYEALKNGEGLENLPIGILVGDNPLEIEEYDEEKHGPVPEELGTEEYSVGESYREKALVPPGDDQVAYSVLPVHVTGGFAEKIAQQITEKLESRAETMTFDLYTLAGKKREELPNFDNYNKEDLESIKESLQENVVNTHDEQINNFDDGPKLR